MKIKNNSLPKITCLVILVIAVITLFVIKAGIADNGLLSATLTDIGLYDHQSASVSGYFADSFGVASKEIGKGSGGLVYGIIKAFLPVDGVLFVYIPAIIYLLLFLTGIYLVLKNSLCGNFGNNVLMCLLSAVIIADSGYVMFFNTPYTEASFISFLAMFIGSFMAYSNKRKKVYLLLAGVFAVIANSQTKEKQLRQYSLLWHGFWLIISVLRVYPVAIINDVMCEISTVIGVIRYRNEE
jgi:hypothetical protein